MSRHITTNPEKERLYRRQYYALHRDKMLDQMRQYNQIRGAELKLAILNRYSKPNPPRCACCGIDDTDVLCVDHINGGGNAHRKQIRVLSGTMFYRWLMKNNYPEGYQILCANCNLKKWVKEKK
mgnify:CR=1 FL=1